MEPEELEELKERLLLITTQARRNSEFNEEIMQITVVLLRLINLLQE